MKRYVIEESPFSHFFLSDTRVAPLWLIIRVYLGWTWLEAGWGKFNNPKWIGDDAGAAMLGFVERALAKTEGAHPDVQWWYAWFLQHAVQPYPEAWAYAITFGEILVGAALIAGLLVGISAFFGLFMNANFLLAGTLSSNPIMAALAIALMLAWRVAGYWGADRYVLPLLHDYIRPRIRAG
ncbi:DoxX family protein [Candidatus Kaiserbacteria bacterium RIFCSPHIGHO2_02_FULL_59_21]|uniref:DoxX family protein n=1 Tax=Candidatus Kaiserbacteria bacterium RIFCSPHIGHO2_02_FULL_59_21 TaxID=1798500 RepID=A0A1F6E1P8_9BACT|nr:MAG: DoxX family protein [Candidatus Kaiserbacteria bacterium RIFCSPHIGHO2_01_FULL_58_22]OGG67588.1 MAG: DoxX family protein [Candidatus Kaiserbacteria bacterium RIFCSPHIGHO2_02_FULL_59_21]OGG80658.1 MAG: DoxX family protein [Candidatus Kaiserbacteria bacterium RIFCSPLOWO2_01_FULL_59_34]OGG85441.1 MAG: DoxX family protein [Candidatus Kaiserbacteria bacterium RIFCSPLOWO2_02_FULL_59_19]